MSNKASGKIISGKKNQKLALLGGKPAFTAILDTYPRSRGNELEELRKVLESRRWNTGYGVGAAQQLEEEFAQYVGARYAVAVNTGGMALQMSLRALGVEPGDEVLFQVDTCSADAHAVMNAQATPIFVDSDPETFMLNKKSLESWITPRSKVLMPIHMWGRPENMDMVEKVARKYNLIVLDDACLALGAEWKGVKAGRFGKIGCFSFGCLKALQTGEGGMIVTDDETLWKELRMLRPWGDMTEVYGVRDQRELAWNGRPSQFVCAVALAQLRFFPKHLKRLNQGAVRLRKLLRDMPGIINMPEDDRITKEAFTQFVFKINENLVGCPRDAFAAALQAEGVPIIWHGAFEPINTLSLWKGKRWRTWINYHDDIDFVARNYAHVFENALHNFHHSGISISRDILTADPDVQVQAAETIRKIFNHAGELVNWKPLKNKRGKR